jgi:hypothetical protein
MTSASGLRLAVWGPRWEAYGSKWSVEIPHLSAHFRSVAAPPPLAHMPIRRIASAYDFEFSMAALASSD